MRTKLDINMADEDWDVLEEINDRKKAAKAMFKTMMKEALDTAAALEQEERAWWTVMRKKYNMPDEDLSLSPSTKTVYIETEEGNGNDD